MEYLPQSSIALGTIIAAWFAYNQYSKNKLTDLKIEKFKKDEETKSIRRADNSSIVYGELWSVLHMSWMPIGSISYSRIRSATKACCPSITRSSAKGWNR